MSNRPRGATSRRAAVATLAAAGAIAVLGPRAAFAQVRRPVIGGLIDQPRATNTNWSNFQATMAGLGWIDGQTVTFAWRFADGDSTRRMPLARELIELAPDVLYAGNVNIAQALKEATATIPIIGALGADDVARELVGRDLSRPAYNVTGSLAAPAPVPILLAQRTALLKEAVPHAMRFGYFINMSAPDEGVAARANAQASAHVAGVKATFLEYRGAPNHSELVALAQRAQVDALGNIIEPWQSLLPIVTAARMPAIWPSREAVAQGGLIGHYTVNSMTDPNPGHRITAAMMDKMLKGAKVADLRPERLPADDYMTAINTAAARSLGIAVPARLLTKIDEKLG